LRRRLSKAFQGFPRLSWREGPLDLEEEAFYIRDP